MAVVYKIKRFSLMSEIEELPFKEKTLINSNHKTIC